MSSNDHLDVYDCISTQTGHKNDDDRTAVGSDIASSSPPRPGATKKYLPDNECKKLQKPPRSEGVHGCRPMRILVMCMCAFAVVVITNGATGFVVWTLLKQTSEEIGSDQPTTIPQKVENETDWYTWAPWTECSRSCGAGQATRNRTCPVEGACDGDNTETRECLPGPCAVNNNTIVETCALYGGVYPHHECQAFYNCSEPASPLYQKDASYIYVHECPYPEIFHPSKLTCTHYKGVSCEGRTEFLKSCDYLEVRVPGRCLRCMPCLLYYPSCEGLPDGRNVYKYRECTRFYVMCESNRTASMNECSPFLYFDPDKRDCLPLDYLPASCYGFAKNCTLLPDGNYKYDGNNPAKYSVCAGGKFQKHESCPFRQIFNEILGTCITDSGVSCDRC